MIPKKPEEKADPTNYRPISVTSCLGKILERVICNRLYFISGIEWVTHKNPVGVQKTSTNL